MKCTLCNMEVNSDLKKCHLQIPTNPKCILFSPPRPAVASNHIQQMAPFANEESAGEILCGEQFEHQNMWVKNQIELHNKLHPKQPISKSKNYTVLIITIVIIVSFCLLLKHITT